MGTSTHASDPEFRPFFAYFPVKVVRYRSGHLRLRVIGPFSGPENAASSKNGAAGLLCAHPPTWSSHPLASVAQTRSVHFLGPSQGSRPAFSRPTDLLFSELIVLPPGRHLPAATRPVKSSRKPDQRPLDLLRFEAKLPAHVQHRSHLGTCHQPQGTVGQNHGVQSRRRSLWRLCQPHMPEATQVPQSPRRERTGREGRVQ